VRPNTFDESLPEPKSSSSVEDDRIDEPTVQDLNGSPSLQVNVSNEGYPKSLKEARGNALDPWICLGTRGSNDIRGARTMGEKESKAYDREKHAITEAKSYSVHGSSKAMQGS
ncbi:hypothetical protein Tco_0868982, partial [Tanacetum coccineum]